MSERNWLKNNAIYIALIIFIILIAITLHGQADRDIKRAREKENRINNIETRLNEQMNYIHELKADENNRKEREALSR